jgi:type I restriction enzyme S subunit
MPKGISEVMPTMPSKRAGWEIKLLSEVCDIERGGSPRPIDSFLTDDPSGINWIKIGDTKGITKYICHTQEKIRPEGAKRSRLVVEGDFILSNSMSFGRPYIMKTTGCIHDGWLLLRPKEPRINQDFLYYVLGSDLIFRQFNLLAAGSTVRNLNIGLVKTVRIPVPPKSEQERIVAVLDEAFERIAAAKANAKTNQDRASSLLAYELSSLIARGKETWTSSTLGSSVKFIDYRGRTPEKTVSGLPLITAKNVRMGYIKDDPREFVAPASYEKWMTRGIPNKGDVLFTTEAPLANVAQLETSERVVFAQRIIIMQPDQRKLDSTFLKFLLLSPPVQKLIHEKGTGATATGIKASLLKTVTILFPSSIKEQVRLSDMLTEVSRDADRLTTLYVQKQDALDSLKQSLLHRAFSGNL